MQDNGKIHSGQRAEENAYQYLRAQGLKLITRNYRCFSGEIDLIMQDNDYLVFVEVRSRNRTDYGTACESVTWKKQSKIIKTAMYFLQQKKEWHTLHLRFDIIGISANQIEWIKDAFSADILL